MTKDTIGKISFHAPALKKSILHALVFGREADFQMVGGTLGGELKKKNLLVHRTFAGATGSESNLNYTDEDYVRLVAFEDELMSKKMFVVGWYVSFRELKELFNGVNHKTHLGYQQKNPNAFVLIINPLNIEKGNLRDVIYLYRLKDPKSEAFKEIAWQILDFELIDADENKFLEDIINAKEVILEGATGFLFSNGQLDLYLEQSSKY